MNNVTIIDAPNLRPGMVIIDRYARTLLVLEVLGAEELHPNTIGCNLPIHHYRVMILGGYSSVGAYGDKETTIKGNVNTGYRLLNPELFTI